MPYYLDYACYLDQSGYSQAAVDTIFALDESGKYDIRISGFHKEPSRQAFSVGARNRLIKMLEKPNRNNDIRVFHCIPEQQSRFKRLSKNISFATFETFDPPSSWISILNNSDAVICPSLFNYKIFSHAGIHKPIFYVPHCINTKIWNANVNHKFHNKFTFLFAGTWKRRKGWPQLIEAWIRSFSVQDNIQLIIKTDKTEQAERDCNLIIHNVGKNNKDIAPILFEKSIFDNEKLSLFYKSADCLIIPTLGEGFGLPAMQCMSLKVPVIVTDFAGCQDYAKEEHCTLLKPSGFLLHDSMDGIPQFTRKKWARITVQDIQIAMRHVLNNKKVIEQKSQNAYEYVRSNFSYEAVVKKFDELMEIF